MHLSPADCAVRAFGGVQALARAVRLYPSSVVRWRQRRGDVPAPAQRRILAEAQARGLPLTAEELIRGREVECAQRCPAPASP